MGKGMVRLLAILGVLLMALGSVGWWLETRVLDADGFGDVVAKTSQRQDVRDYLAEPGDAAAGTGLELRLGGAARRDRGDLGRDRYAAVTRRTSTSSSPAPTADLPGRRAARRVSVDSAEAAVGVRSGARDDQPRAGQEAAAQHARRDDDHLAVGAPSTRCSVRASGCERSTSRSSSPASDSSILVAYPRARPCACGAGDRYHAAITGALGVGIGAATGAFASVAATSVRPGRRGRGVHRRARRTARRRRDGDRR